MADVRQGTWFGVPPVALTSPGGHHLRATDPNPVIAIHGPGPNTARCGTCSLFVRHQHGQHRYGKCRRRGFSHGEGTDHYATWPACGRYVKEDVL